GLAAPGAPTDSKPAPRRDRRAVLKREGMPRDAASRRLEPVVMAQTVAGELLLPKSDTVITPDLVKLGVWEGSETACVQRTLRAGQTFVDVGAHVGYYSLLAAGLV